MNRPNIQFYLALLCCVVDPLNAAKAAQHTDANGKIQVVPVTLMYTNNKDPVIPLEDFETCELSDCNEICGHHAPTKSFCEPKNDKLCMCSTENFISSNVKGVVVPVNLENPAEKNCSVACNIRNSYGRVWYRHDKSKLCACLLQQVTVTGITLCDELALTDVCKSLCGTDTAFCAFNGICLCRQNWEAAFKKTLSFVRDEEQGDKRECSKLCKEFHPEYVARIYDKKADTPGEKTYEFGEKYCMCGDEIEPLDTSMQMRLYAQGFQDCGGYKCKMSCGMDMNAQCEPRFKRACFCPHSNIFIGKWLWARLPGRKETICVETCINSGLAPRVIEWNPFFDPMKDMTLPVYRNSKFSYLYDGKFCHCINLENEPNTDQFRPCSDELCQWICGHHEATCDEKTRRVCMCNTHQMVAGLGRKPDPGEANCDIICRRNLKNARILEMIWDIPAPDWTVTHAKFCGCIRPVSPAGLTHCESLEGNDSCPKLCNNTHSFCTRDKVCECFNDTDILKNPFVRVPNGNEAEECGEKCRSWTWPLAIDVDRKPYIYDETRKNCIAKHNCPKTDTTPWHLTQPGALQIFIDAQEAHAIDGRKFCLCVKSNSVQNAPGLRIPFTLEPPRLPRKFPCILNYTCMGVSDSLHIVA